MAVGGYWAVSVSVILWITPTDPGTAMIQLETFGAVDLRREGESVRAVLAQPRRLLLIAFLATARPRGFHSRDRLLGLFWPHSEPERARNSLRQALHHLRRALGDEAFLSRGDHEIAVNPTVLRCDAVAFDEALEAGDREAAVRLYRGEFLPGLFLDGAADLERHLEDERARYRRAAVRALWEMVEAEQARGDLGAAVIHAREALNLDPYDEAGLRRTLELMERTGDCSAGIRLYEDFARRLREDLELEPGVETHRLADRLRHSPETPVPRPTRPERSPPLDDHSMAAPGPPERATRRPWWLFPVALAVVALGVALLTRPWGNSLAPSAGSDQVTAVAVLPFVNMSGDPGNEYLADGISVELMSALSRVPGLNVVGYTSAFAYKGKDVPVDSIGRALRVGHVLEGSTRVTGNRVRIVATLIDARSGYHVWSDTYDADLGDVLGVQDRISRAIVAALRPRFGTGEGPERPPRLETADPEAHADVLRGMQALRSGTPEDYQNAKRFFVRALTRDSLYARAHAGLAGIYLIEALLGAVARAEGYAQAAAAAERALALDPTVPEAHGALARIAMDFRRDYEEADRRFQRAIELSPGSETWYRQRGRLLSILGRHTEALALARKSVELDPLAPGAHRFLGGLRYYAGQYELALEALNAGLALAPDQPYTLGLKAEVLTVLGRHTEAIEVAEQALAGGGENQLVFAQAGAAYAAAGDTLRAEALIRRMEVLPQPSPFLIAEVVAWYGTPDRVFALLEAAADEDDPLVIGVGMMPNFHRFRGDPRMVRLVERLGLQ